MEHYVRPDDADDPPPPTPDGSEPLRQRLMRWLSAVVADREPPRQPPNLIRNPDGTSTIIDSGNHGGAGG